MDEVRKLNGVTVRAMAEKLQQILYGYEYRWSISFNR